MTGPDHCERCGRPKAESTHVGTFGPGWVGCVNPRPCGFAPEDCDRATIARLEREKAEQKSEQDRLLEWGDSWKQVAIAAAEGQEKLGKRVAELEATVAECRNSLRLLLEWADALGTFPPQAKPVVEHAWKVLGS